MKFFIDTANVEDIKKANDMGVICGVTTNPSLIAKEGRDFNEVISEIASIVDLSLIHIQKAVIQPPQHKVPTGSVPQPGQRPDDQDISDMFGHRYPVSA